VSDARARILAAVRAATADVPRDEPAAEVWTPPSGGAADLDLLDERIADYRATVTRAGDLAGAADAVAAILARHGATRVAVPHGLPPELHIGHGVEAVSDDPPLTAEQLSAVDGVVTTAGLAIAETGTIVLDGGPGQGRRALSLLPDLHVCVVRAHQVRATVGEAVAELATITRPVTFISGPSATSDIELDRVEGVHGPRRLEVVLVG
jgi:L-lactate dehydrogenase complex protein LldG